MIEVGQHPGGPGALILHSTESGQFFACERVEFERLIAAGIRGELDDVLLFKASSATADGDPDWQRARRALTEGGGE
jgi:hypothetical protein